LSDIVFLGLLQDCSLTYVLFMAALAEMTEDALNGPLK
jgi:hypothetical protein